MSLIHSPMEGVCNIIRHEMKGLGIDFNELKTPFTPTQQSAEPTTESVQPSDIEDISHSGFATTNQRLPRYSTNPKDSRVVPYDNSLENVSTLADGIPLARPRQLISRSPAMPHAPPFDDPLSTAFPEETCEVWGGMPFFMSDLHLGETWPVDYSGDSLFDIPDHI